LLFTGVGIGIGYLLCYRHCHNNSNITFADYQKEMNYHGGESHINNSQIIVAKSKDGAIVHYRLEDSKNYATISQNSEGEGVLLTYHWRSLDDHEIRKIKVVAYTDAGDENFIEVSLLPVAEKTVEVEQIPQFFSPGKSETPDEPKHTLTYRDNDRSNDQRLLEYMLKNGYTSIDFDNEYDAVG
jgi:hypothetical protein